MMTNYFQYLEYAWDCTEQSETVLVHSAQSGNLEAFNALVMKYQDLMYGLALRILGEDALAEDATQEAFISAYQHIVNFRGGSLKAWLMRILVNKCYDDSRRMQRTSTISLNEGLTGECEDQRLSVKLQDRVPTVEECVEAAEQNEYIQKCLGKLPTDYRIILALVDIEEMSYREASAALKIRMGTVKSRLARARLCLRRELNAGDVF